MAKSGSLSINSENIFPIIKKWLYSDHESVYRELVSNGCDAITKLRKETGSDGKIDPGDVSHKVQVTVNPKEKTIRIEDNGLGVDERMRLTSISTRSLSPAPRNFLNKYKDKANEDQML